MNAQSEASTRLIARVVGPYLVVSMVLYVAATNTQALVSEIGSNMALAWITGAIHLLGGFTVLGLQREWRSPAAIVVTVIGLIAVVEGVVLTMFPDAYLAAADSASIVAAAAVTGLIGLYLTYVGWRPAPAAR